MLEFILTMLWEVLVQLFGGLLIEAGFSSLGEPFRKRSKSHPLLAGAGVLILGGLIGALTRLAWPERIFQPGPVRGLSLIVSPLVTGMAMHRFGEWCEGRGLSRSYIDTFWGGALLAFGVALVRFLWIADSV